MTRNESTYCHLVPLEVVGWLMRKLEITEGQWVLVVTCDDLCNLPAQLVMRAPVSINVCLGLTVLRSVTADMARLDQWATERMIPSVKEANGLPSVPWNLGSPWGMGWEGIQRHTCCTYHLKWHIA